MSWRRTVCFGLWRKENDNRHRETPGFSGAHPHDFLSLVTHSRLHKSLPHLPFARSQLLLSALEPGDRRHAWPGTLALSRYMMSCICCTLAGVSGHAGHMQQPGTLYATTNATVQCRRSTPGRPWKTMDFDSCIARNCKLQEIALQITAMMKASTPQNQSELLCPVLESMIHGEEVSIASHKSDCIIV